jgi:hypothetical protein
LCSTTGGFRPYVEQVLGAAVRLLAQQCLTDPYFVVFPDGRELDEDEEIMKAAQETHMTMKGIDAGRNTHGAHGVRVNPLGLYLRTPHRLHGVF